MVGNGGSRFAVLGGWEILHRQGAEYTVSDLQASGGEGDHEPVF